MVIWWEREMIYKIANRWLKKLLRATLSRVYNRVLSINIAKRKSKMRQLNLGRPLVKKGWRTSLGGTCLVFRGRWFSFCIASRSLCSWPSRLLPRSRRLLPRSRRLAARSCFWWKVSPDRRRRFSASWRERRPLSLALWWLMVSMWVGLILLRSIPRTRFWFSLLDLESGERERAKVVSFYFMFVWLLLFLAGYSMI